MPKITVQVTVKAGNQVGISFIGRQARRLYRRAFQRMRTQAFLRKHFGVN